MAKCFYYNHLAITYFIHWTTYGEKTRTTRD